MSGPAAALRVSLVVFLSLVLAAGPRTLVGAQQTTAELLPTGPVTGAIRFEAQPGTVITTATGRYGDTVEVRRAPVSDLTVVNELSFDDYVAGIAEMPASWPMEALKAQAVAARTYGWFELAQGRWKARGLGYDVCSTTSCQVFRGLKVVETPEVGQRWRQAVDETAGEVLVQGGRPILARYFSTSGGLRWANDVIFPSSGSYSYLVGGPDPDDAVSPLHKWEVRFTADQFQDLLSRGTSLGAATPYARVQSVASSTPGITKALRVTGRDGTVVEVGAVAFRTFVSNVAPNAWPDQFPGPRLEGPGRLPATMPSSRFEVDVRDGEDVVIHGSGWGHGVGMGQYGAKGKADRGLDHREILAAYYNGLRPVTSSAVPDRIRVGVQNTSEPVVIDLDGPARLLVGGTLVTERALGRWEIRRVDADRVLLVPPTGFGEPISVTQTSSTRTQPSEVEVVTIAADVNKTVELRMEVRDVDTGVVVHQRDLGIVAAGEQEVRWSLDDADRVGLPPAAYDVALVATDEEGVPMGTPVRLAIRPFAGDGEPRLPATLLQPARAIARTGPGAVPFGVAGAVGVFAGIALGVAVTRRRRPSFSAFGTQP